MHYGPRNVILQCFYAVMSTIHGRYARENPSRLCIMEVKGKCPQPPTLVQVSLNFIMHSSRGIPLIRRKLVHCNHPLQVSHYDLWQEDA